MVLVMWLWLKEIVVLFSFCDCAYCLFVDLSCLVAVCCSYLVVAERCVVLLWLV